MDFVIKLSLLKEPWIGYEYNSILVITDRLTKYIYIVLYNKSSTAEILLQVFLRIIIANHGISREIISDRDKLFILKFWTTLMALLGTKRKLSSAFYLQIDGQTERVNQIMEVYLYYYINYKQNNWVELLPLAQYIYNNTESESTGIMLFFANYRYTPTAYEVPLIDSIYIQGAIMKIEELKTLY
jgi:GT2 family glycosyltransferase